MRIVPAASLALDELTGLFNAGYSGYLTPVSVDGAGMRRHLGHNDIDLGVSRVTVTDAPVSFVLVGRRGSEAWIGGLGTVPAARRQGVAEYTLSAALQSAAGDGALSVRLEVLERNEAAIALYEKLGFTTIRRLVVCALRGLPPPRGSWREIPVDAAREWIGAHRRSAEPWQRGDAALDHVRVSGEAVSGIAVDDGNGGGATAAMVWAPDALTPWVVQLAARDEEAAEGALLAAGALAAGKPVGLLNFPIGEPVAAAVSALGIAPDHVQFEMQLALGAASA